VQNHAYSFQDRQYDKSQVTYKSGRDALQNRDSNMNWKNAGENSLYGWFRTLVVELVLATVGLRQCGSIRFLRTEVHRKLLYLLCNPWVISRRFLNSRGEENAQGYGETPLTTLASVARRLHLSPGDRFVELGCGTGRNCLWLADRYGCQILGVEQIQVYVDFANKLARRHMPDCKVSFVCTDMFELQMSEWDCVYVDCTAMSKSCIRRLALLCAGLPNGARLVTVNAALADLMPERFQVESVFPGLFAWGWSEVRIHRVGPPL